MSVPSWPASGPEAIAHRALSAAAERRRELLLVGGAVLLAKLVLLGFDPDPRFFLGDSATYVRSAVDGFVPRDRSFTYGVLIWLTAVLPHSLHGLVLAQTAAGIASALLVFVIARDLLGARFPYAAGAALAVALEPAQLFYERMVMAEAFGGLVFLSFVACVLAYARNGSLRWLLGAVALGILGVTFRQNFILVAIVLPILVPVVRRLRAAPPAIPWRAVLPHVAVAVLATTAVHTGYRHLIGHLTDSAPGYIGEARMFKLGFVAPLVKPGDFAGTDCPRDVLQQVTIPIADPLMREAHLWSPGGLWDVMVRLCRHPEDAAGIVADRALDAAPLQLLPMAAAIVAQHFDDASARWRMDSDLGRYPLYDDFATLLKQRFGLNADAFPYRDTATSRWFDRGRWWFTWTYFATPFLVAAIAWRSRRRGEAAAAATAFAWIAGLLFLGQLLFTHILSYRYLYSFPVLALLAAAYLLSPPRARAER